MMPSSEPSAPSSASLAARGRQWSPERWASFNLSRAPGKPDPDVVAIAGTLDITYYRARMLKALSFGILVDGPLLGWAAGHGADGRAAAQEVFYLRHLVSIRCVLPPYGGASSFIIDDPESLRLIRDAMAGRS